MITADKATKNYIPKFKIVYKYRLKNYNNYNKYYYILDITGHLPLNNRYLIVWNNAINNKTVNIETPPISLVGQMVAE